MQTRLIPCFFILCMLANPACITLELYSFFSCTFHCKPGLFLFVSSKNPAGSLLFHPLYVCRPGLFLSSVCLKTRPVPFLSVKPGLFLFSVCLQARSIPALVFSMCLQTRLFLSSVCLQTRSIAALFFYMFSKLAHHLHVRKTQSIPALFFFFFSVCLRSQHIPYFSSCECLKAGPAYSGSFPLYVCKPRLSLFFCSVCQI